MCVLSACLHLLLVLLLCCLVLLLIWYECCLLGSSLAGQIQFSALAYRFGGIKSVVVKSPSRDCKPHLCTITYINITTYELYYCCCMCIYMCCLMYIDSFLVGRHYRWQHRSTNNHTHKLHRHTQSHTQIYNVSSPSPVCRCYHQAQTSTQPSSEPTPSLSAGN